MASLATNENGAHFLTQLAQGPKHLDVFAVFGLPAVGDALNHHTLRSHFRIKVMRHLFQREHPVGLTHGPKVPTWAIANQAKEILYALDSDGLQSMQRLWAGRSVSTWNPFADAGTPAALRALDVSCRREWAPRALLSFPRQTFLANMTLPCSARSLLCYDEGNGGSAHQKRSRQRWPGDLNQSIRLC